VAKQTGRIAYAVVGVVVSALVAAVSRVEIERRHVSDAAEGASTSGRSELPSGACILVANHTSLADGPLLALLGRRTGRRLRLLGTAGIIEFPLLRWLFRRLGYIPVRRKSANPASALEPAAAALRNGDAIALYPEGRITRDRRFWPERGKTGAVRLALETGAPILPVASVGAERVVGRRHVVGWLLINTVRRPKVRMKIGAPIDVGRWLGLPLGAQATAEQLRAATDEVMRRLVDLVEELRGEDAPDPIGVVRPEIPTA
jgi:1-acyl-sn-glycerol-3-phosphate acyltransferase